MDSFSVLNLRSRCLVMCPNIRVWQFMWFIVSLMGYKDVIKGVARDLVGHG